MEKVNIPQTPYYRDLHSKAILNTDKRSRDKYLMDREIALKEKAEKDANVERIDKLEQDIGEIKSMLLKILDRKSTRLNSSHIPLSRMPSSA